MLAGMDQYLEATRVLDAILNRCSVHAGVSAALAAGGLGPPEGAVIAQD